MREVVRYFFRADTKTPHFNDRTNRHASFADHGFSARIRHRLRYKSGDQHFPIESSPFIGLVYHGHHRHSIFSYDRIRQAKKARSTGLEGSSLSESSVRLRLSSSTSSAASTGYRPSSPPGFPT